MIIPDILHCSSEGIYYIHNYVPVRAFSYSSEDEDTFSRELWDYKRSEEQAIKLISIHRFIFRIKRLVWLQYLLQK